MRIGQSIDIHAFAKDRDLILGGVKIEHTCGLAGHSDADALLHAIMESILGALALGDLGKHFPDTDPAYKGINSMKLCKHVCDLMKKEGYRIGNIDATIVIEKPKMAPYIDCMRANVANVFECDIQRVSIKATRGEKLGFVGHEEGVCALSCCLLEEE